ncbi:MAG: FAD-dependent oxidoreductase [Deltaproteobacteria bacterium]|nr:FAD-dependent oxidoreductase [Deltaproteobacteria bacterium]
MSREANRFTRRSLLKLGGCAAAGSVLLPALQGCARNLLKLPLPFGGQVKGERYAAGHELRDGRLAVQVPPAEGPLHDAVIIGGGPCGLACAWKLLRSGMESVLVVDKEDVLGGLCRGGTEDGLSFVVGSHYTDFPHPACKHLGELFQELGIIVGFTETGWPIIDERTFLKQRDARNIFTGSVWHHDEFPHPLASGRDERELERFEETCRRWSSWADGKNRPAFGIPIARISRAPEVRALDEISLTTWLEREGYRSDLLRWFLTNRLQDEYGTPIERLPAWAGIQFFRTVLPDPDAADRGNEPNSLTWDEGLGFLGRRMDALLPDAWKRTGLWAVRVENLEGGRVRTICYDPRRRSFHTFLSRHAVVAVPKMQVYDLVCDLEAAGRTEFEDLPYVSWLVAVVHLDRLPTFPGGSVGWDNLLYGSWTLGYLDNQHQHTPAVAPDKPHVLSLYAAFPYNTKQERYEMLSYGWDYWARLILLELERAHPDIRRCIRKMDIWKWGHPMRQTHVGTIFGPLRRQMCRPFGHVHFGHADVCAIPVFEEASARGVEIAESILADLGVDFRSSLEVFD